MPLLPVTLLHDRVHLSCNYRLYPLSGSSQAAPSRLCPARLYLKAQFQAGHRLGGRPLVLVTVGLLVVVVMVSNC